MGLFLNRLAGGLATCGGVALLCAVVLFPFAACAELPLASTAATELAARAGYPPGASTTPRPALLWPVACVAP